MPDRPNVVLFMPDQMRADCAGAFGNPLARTPNLDALAARGTTFRQAFSQHSVCSPSRASILTGTYPHTGGHRTLSNLLELWEPNLLRYFKDAGYTVVWAGARGDTFAPGVTEASTEFYGFSQRPQFRGQSPFLRGHRFAEAFYHGRREVDGVALDFDEAAVRTAEEWLGGAPREPWLLFVPLVFPHLPFAVEEPWFSMLDRAAMPLPAGLSLVQQDAAGFFAGRPRFMGAIYERYGLQRLSVQDWQEIAATYYGMVSRVDWQLGRVLEAVERTGAGGRTITAFFSDHGEYLGDYGLVEKWPSGLEDCLVRNPLVIAAPDGRPGNVCDSLVEMVDLLPTLLELCSIEVHHTHFGRSLVPLLHDGALPHRAAAFSEGGFVHGEERLLERGAGFPYELKQGLQHEDLTLVGKATALRTERWTYVHRLYERDELYDRAVDPAELHNLAGTPEVADTERWLRDQMLDWLVETGDTIPWDEDPRSPRVEHRPLPGTA